MARGIGVLTSHAIGRAAKVLTLVGALSAPSAASADNSATPLIRIPPAPPPHLVASAPSATATKIVPAARAFLPNRMLVLTDPNESGIVMYGPLPSAPASAASIVLAVVAEPDAFDAAPSAQLIVADENDRHAQALFTAVARGRTVIGVATATLGESAGDVSLVYDNADTFAESFPRLENTLVRTAAIEIGVMDNSACDCETAVRAMPNLGWRPIIAATAAAEGEARIDASLTQALVDKLSNEMARPWRLLSSAEWK